MTLVPAPTCTPNSVCLRNEDFGTIDSTSYKIDANIQLTDVDQADAFAAALSRWQGVITDAQSSFDVSGYRPPGDCTNAVPDIVSSVYICAEVAPITDESGGIVENVVGLAGPTLTRPRGETNITGTTIMGFVKISPDIVGDDIFNETIVHEIGHVLGIGMFQLDMVWTLWNSSRLLTFKPGTKWDENIVDEAEGIYTAEAGNRVWKDTWGCTQPLPISNDGGHWKEECFIDEALTPLLTQGEDARLSSMTLAAIEDLGYKVDYDAADQYNEGNLDLQKCCKVAPSDMQPQISLQKGKEVSSNEARNKAIEYGKKLLLERSRMQQLSDEVHQAGDSPIYVGDKVVMVFYRYDGRIFEVRVTQ